MSVKITSEIALFGYFLGSLISSYCLSTLFIRIWKSYSNVKRVPKGFGFIYSLFLFGHFFFIDSSQGPNIFIALVVFFSIIYLLDDLIELSPFIRIFLIATFSLSVIIFSEIDFIQFYINSAAGAFLIFFILNFYSVNMTNFYDGADLNLALLMSLFNLNLIILCDLHTKLFEISIMSIGFILGFAYLNKKPKTLYFGDAGSFVFSSYIIYVIDAFWKRDGFIDPIVLVPLLLPSIDVCFTLAYRLYKKENVLTRNHYHIYQRLEKNFKSKYYLIPQIINFLCCHVFFIFYTMDQARYIFEVGFFLIVISLVVYLISNFFCIQKCQHKLYR